MHTEGGERIARLGVSRVVSSPDDDTLTMSMEEEAELQFSDAPSMSLQMDMDHEADEESEGAEGSEGDVSGQKNTEEGVEASPCIDQCWCARNWESIVGDSEGLVLMTPALALIPLSLGPTAHSTPVLST